MAELKMPEINSVVIAGNLTKDPVFRQTNSGGTPVVNFSIACNRRFRDSNHQWQEDVCYVGVVAWNKLAESCRDNLRKSAAVLVDGELQSRTWKAQDGSSRTVVEIKARRIQFLNKRKKSADDDDEHSGFIEDDYQHDGNPGESYQGDNPGHIYEYKYLSSE